MAYQFPRFSRSLRAHTSLDRPVPLANDAKLAPASNQTQPKRDTLWKELKLFAQQIGHDPASRQLQRLWTFCHSLIGNYTTIVQQKTGKIMHLF